MPITAPHRGATRYSRRTDPAPSRAGRQLCHGSAYETAARSAKRIGLRSAKRIRSGSAKRIAGCWTDGAAAANAAAMTAKRTTCTGCRSWRAASAGHWSAGSSASARAGPEHGAAISGGAGERGVVGGGSGRSAGVRRAERGRVEALATGAATAADVEPRVASRTHRGAAGQRPASHSHIRPSASRSPNISRAVWGRSNAWLLALLKSEGRASRTLPFRW
jgi:hypothetical protein